MTKRLTKHNSPSACRLQQFLSQAGVCSRRAGEGLILSGRVAVNGHVVTKLGTKLNPDRDQVTLDSKPIHLEQKRLYLFYKPRNVISTLHDPQGRPCLAAYVKSLPVRVYSAGRLDFDVSGLMLLTNDGQFAQSLLHPKYMVPRTYIAQIEGQPPADFIRRLIKGISLSDGLAKTSSASLSPYNLEMKRLFPKANPRQNSFVKLTVLEGRKHFVKRLLEAVGTPVIELCRVSFGDYRLGNLRPGQVVEVKNKPIP